MLFRVFDYRKAPVILTKMTWNRKILDPVFGHPEVKPFLLRVKTTIKSPDYVFQSIRDERSMLFYKKITLGIYTSYFLAVVVKYVKEKKNLVGYVSTIMINRKLPVKSKLIWEKEVLI